MSTTRIPRSNRNAGYCLLILASYLIVVPPVHAQSSKTVILVRHAEKMSESARDPSLTAAGVTRAAALADALMNMKIDHVITSQYQRTIETAAPIVDHRNLTPEIIKAGTSAEALGLVVSAVEKRLPGEAVLIVGHSNTIPKLLGALGGSKIPDLEDHEYDSIFIVTLTEGRDARTMRLRFGEPNG